MTTLATHRNLGGSVNAERTHAFHLPNHGYQTVRELSEHLETGHNMTTGYRYAEEMRHMEAHTATRYHLTYTGMLAGQTLCGDRVKIGTCEDMLYLRWDQAAKVTPESDSLDPNDPAILGAIRFRFPWPDEDGVDPGAFDDYDRGLRLDGFAVPADVQHSTTQFKSNYPDNGYLISLPCPESMGEDDVTVGGHAYRIHKNGYGGSASLIQQAWRGGRLVGIAKCNGCGSVFRLDDGAEEAAAVAIRSAADSIIRWGRPAQSAARLHEIADRLLAGYQLTAPTREAQTA